jgi:endonuclease-3 related protein
MVYSTHGRVFEMKKRVAAGGGREVDGIVTAVYEALYDRFGAQGWWPVTASGEAEARYSGGPACDGQRFEVAAGAVLTQNTSWANASRAVGNLVRRGALDPESILSMDVKMLAELIKSSGYYNRKASILKGLAGHFSPDAEISRESLLALSGIGPETADSIMLYAFGEPLFVVDAYTMRVFSRIGLIVPEERYENVRAFFEGNLPVDAAIFQEYHALIVKLAKEYCRRNPLCDGCPLYPLCGRKSA